VTRNSKPAAFEGSESELRALTAQVDEAHRATLPQMHAAAVSLGEEVREREAGLPSGGLDRRRFLAGLGAAGVAAFTLAACGDDGKSSSGKASPSASNAPQAAPMQSGAYTGDLLVVALAVALENQAVGAYQAAIQAAGAGKLGAVPPAVATFATTAMAQHADHAKVWNNVLTQAGKPPITGVPLKSQAAVTDALGKVTDVPGVAKLALQLEDQAAQTYLFAQFNVTAPAGIATAATIAPVEAMHAAILNYLLGQYPVPDDFLPIDKAAKTSDLTGEITGDMTGGTSAGPSSGPASITIDNFAFSPATLAVAPGATVTVVNKDTAAHTVTAADKSFDTGTIAPGATKTFNAPNKPGSYGYKCTIHPFMTAGLTVG
jgi:plastocyanin